MLWSRNYSGISLNGIVSNGGRLFATGSEGGQGLVLELDRNNGNVLSSVELGGSGKDSLNKIAVSESDGSLYAIGTTDSIEFGATGNDIWIVHLAAQQAIPEPNTIALLALGSLFLLVGARSQTRKMAIQKRAVLTIRSGIN